MESNYDDENDMEFGSMPSFIPKDAPEVKPPEVKGEAELKSAYEEAINRLVEGGQYSEGYGREVLDEILAEMKSGALTDLGAEGKLLHYGFATADTVEALRDALRRERKAVRSDPVLEDPVLEDPVLEDPVLEVQELADGTRVEMWRDAAGQAHHEGAAAIVKIFPNGTMEEQWFQHGKLHREDGPAVTHADGTQEHWINGERRIELETVVSVDPARQESPAASVLVPAAEATASPAVDREEVEGNQQVLPDVLKALMAAAKENAEKQAEQAQYVEKQAVLNPGAVLAQPAVPVASGAPVSGGGAGAQAAQSGLRSLADGGLGLVGGLAALAGAVGRGVGGAARTLASEVEAKRQAGDAAPVAPRFAPGISVLPRISEYRVEQAEKMANAYESAMEKFWTSGKLPDVRRAIEEHARETGASVPDVMAKMVPGGELEGLRTRFVEAVGESPDAQDSKKAMDRALDSWVRQYGRGSEELLNPETGQNPDYDSMRERFEGTREKMAGLVTQSPVFAGEEKSHAERFREAVERIAQRIQEMLQRVAEFIRGRSAGADQREEAGYEP